MTRKPALALIVLFALLLNVSGVVAQGGGPSSQTSAQAALGTAFTYQGQLKNGSGFVTGPCDFQFGLWDAPTLGAQSGVTQTVSTTVTSGLFTVSLNGGVEFGASAFTGSAGYLQIAVKCASDSGFTAFSSRQALTPAPYAFALPGLYTQPNATSPNIIAGYGGNVISATVVGGAIGGGGSSGLNNRVTDNYSVVAGGSNNQAGNADGVTNNAQYATVGGGQGNIASGLWATVPGGEFNTASGAASFAAGHSANAVTNGAFVWADDSLSPLFSTAPNQFLVRASGGITLYADPNANVGVALYTGSSSWSVLSDRNFKANVRPLDPVAILNQVAAVPIQTWNYTTQNESIRHIGPMAQDFYAAFNVGENNTTISTVDAQGVAFAAIQGLYQVVQAKAAQIVEQQTQITALQSQMDEQAQELRRLKELVAGKAPLPSSNSQNIPWFIAGGMMSLLAFGLGRRGKGGGR